jgi:4-diphosphocytidyl-2-C-methyl-D-erythritol kinase
MKQLTLYPGAKINIGLYVFEKREDGFHEIESIFYPVGPDNSNLEPDILTVTVFRDKKEFCSFLSDDASMEENHCSRHTGNACMEENHCSCHSGNACMEENHCSCHTENACMEEDRLSGRTGETQKVLMLETGLEYPGNPEDNICVKAYEMLDADYQLPPAVIVLEKHLPVGAGLGGGSSDGVCTLKALNELCNLNLTQEQLTSYAEKLGSDCPFFVQNEPRLVTGRGEILTPLTELPAPGKELQKDNSETGLQKDNIEKELPGNESAISKALKNLSENYTVQIVFSPDCFVSTKKAYSIVPKRKKNGLGDENDERPYVPVTEAITMPVEKWQGRIVNDFEAPVFKEFPQLEKVKDSLKETGAVYVSMTGSGSAIFGLFPNKEV